MDIIFTNHARYRINKRDVSEQEIIDSIKNPDKTKKKHGKYYIDKDIGRGIIEIVYEKEESYIKVITIYWI